MTKLHQQILQKLRGKCPHKLTISFFRGRKEWKECIACGKKFRDEEGYDRKHR